MPRNILFLFSDQHAQKVSGAYGDPVVQTPNIDRLAKEGLRFDNAYCPSPICVPSRMSTLTARHPSSQECWANDDILRSDLPTWLHSVGAAGYDPVLIGRMHAIGPDQFHGYADRQIGDHSPNFPGAKRQPMGPLEKANDPYRESLDKSGAGMSAYQAKDEDVTDAAVKWLQGAGAAKIAKGAPFCLSVGLMLPHPPYVADQDAFDLYDGHMPAPTLGADDMPGAFHAWWRKARGIEDVPECDAARARAAYWALVHRMDEMIGRILNALEAIGAMDDTLIVYASDHGDHLGERGLWWKHTFFDESAKVPLIMRLPGVLPAGEVRKQVVSLIDLSQTMLDAIGAQQLPNADGDSFWPVAQHANAPWKDEAFCEYCTDPVPNWTNGRAVQQRMIRSGHWKLSVYDSEPPLLFDLATDPNECVDRANDPACAAILADLMQRLLQGWDPETIAKQMRVRRADKDILAAWASRVQPAGNLIWQFNEDTNRLIPKP